MTVIAMNTTKPTTPLRLSEGEAAALTHDSYLAQIRTQACLNCNCGERWVELFEIWTHPTKTAQTNLAIKRPTSRLLPGFALSYFEIPTTSVPVCSECITTYKVAEGDLVPAASRSAWAETLQRKYAPAPTPTKSGRPEPTLDSL